MLLYKIFRTSVRYCLQFYCKRLSMEGVENIPHDKPILFCSTHSNSFLDALFLAACLDYPVYPLARGDAFRKPLIAKILTEFRVLPIFRQTDGEANALAKNEASFNTCQQLFIESKKVLIFPEGFSRHQKELLPLKKGAATMVQRAWSEDIDLQVIPVGVTYDSFFKWGKKCDVIIEKPLQKADFQDIENMNFSTLFNAKLETQIKKLYPSPFSFQNNRLYRGVSSQMMYYCGWLINAPLYLFAYVLGRQLTKGTVFHDSAILGLTAVLLPFYWVMLLVVLSLWF